MKESVIKNTKNIVSIILTIKAKSKDKNILEIKL